MQEMTMMEIEEVSGGEPGPHDNASYTGTDEPGLGYWTCDSAAATNCYWHIVQ